MPSQLLVNVITVTVPDGALFYPAPHGLKSNGEGVAPTLIMPKEQSPVVVEGVDESNVYLTNSSASPVTVTFRCERGLSNELDAATATPFFQSVGSGIIPPPPPSFNGYASANTNDLGTQTGTITLGFADINTSSGTMNLEVDDGQFWLIRGHWDLFSIRNVGVENTVRLGIISNGYSVQQQDYVVPANGVINIPQMFGSTVALIPITLTNPFLRISKLVNTGTLTYDLRGLQFTGMYSFNY